MGFYSLAHRSLHAADALAFALLRLESAVLVLDEAQVVGDNGEVGRAPVERTRVLGPCLAGGGLGGHQLLREAPHFGYQEHELLRVRALGGLDLLHDLRRERVADGQLRRERHAVGGGDVGVGGALLLLALRRRRRAVQLPVCPTQDTAPSLLLATDC